MAVGGATSRHWGVTAEEAAHLASAIEVYATRCAANGRLIPPRLLQFRIELAAIAVPQRAIQGQPGPMLDEGLTSAEGGTERKLLTYREAAQTLGISVRTLKRRVAAGDLEPVRVGGGNPRIRMSDIERLVAEGA